MTLGRGEIALVTGATGFVGAHLARRLAGAGWQVRALARSGSPRWLLEDTTIDWRTGDLRDPVSLEAALQGCSVLFHCAADYRLWSARPAELYEVNLDGTRQLLEAARRTGIRRTVYTSTVGALGLPPEGGAGDEETPTSLDRMVGDYKRSKFLAEEVAREAAASGMDLVIVNPSTPVGPGDLKPTPTGKLILDFLNGRMPAYLDTGLNLIHVQDVAVGHLLALEKGVSGRRYVLGNRNMTLHSILELLAEVTGRPAPQIRIPYRVAYGAGWLSTAAAKVLRRPPGIALDSVKMAHAHMFFSNARAVEELGLPRTPIRDALREAVRWFIEHGYVVNKTRRSTITERLLQSSG